MDGRNGEGYKRTAETEDWKKFAFGQRVLERRSRAISDCSALKDYQGINWTQGKNLKKL